MGFIDEKSLFSVGQEQSLKDESRREYELFCKWENVKDSAWDYGIWLAAWFNRQSDIDIMHKMIKECQENYTNVYNRMIFAE